MCLFDYSSTYRPPAGFFSYHNSQNGSYYLDIEPFYTYWPKEAWALAETQFLGKMVGAERGLGFHMALAVQGVGWYIPAHAAVFIRF